MAEHPDQSRRDLSAAQAALALRRTHAALRAQRLFQLADNDDDWFTVGNAIEGIQIFGATGSGKTSGSGQTIAISFLEQGWGGLVLTAKQSDIADWREWAAATGREADIIDLRPDGEYQFNFLEYELARAAKQGSTQDVVSLFVNAIGFGGESGASSDAYWDDALQQLITNTIDLAVLSGANATTELLASIVRTAPQTLDETTSHEWQDRSECWRLIKHADTRNLDDRAARDLDETISFWLQEFPALSLRTRSIIVSSFMSKVTGLLRYPLRELFAFDHGVRQATPELTHEGKILIVNIPVKRYGETARFAQRIMKIVWQRATENRTIDADTRPVFLWADESQYFVTPDDGLFQQTARSSLAATVYLTQNISNYWAASTKKDPKAQTDSLMGNLQTKIFHANGDGATNRWAQDLIGSDFESRSNSSISSATGGAEKGNITRGRGETLVPVVRSRVFTTLQKGGGEDSTAHAIVFQGGRTWKANGENYLRTAFHQGG